MITALRTLVFTTAIISIIAGCSSGKQYTGNLDSSSNLKSIAILPAQVQHRGLRPKKMTIEDYDQLLAWESRAFQRALNDNLLRYSGGRRKIAGITFQSIDKTNGILNRHGYSWETVAKTDPDEIAKLLGVDAVVKMEVSSTRIMSDMASMITSAAKNILFFGTNADPILTSSIPSSTGDLSANAALLYKGSTLWTASYNRETDWKKGSEEVLTRVTRKMGKGFPY